MTEIGREERTVSIFPYPYAHLLFGGLRQYFTHPSVTRSTTMEERE